VNVEDGVVVVGPGGGGAGEGGGETGGVGGRIEKWAGVGGGGGGGAGEAGADAGGVGSRKAAGYMVTPWVVGPEPMMCQISSIQSS